MKRATIRLFKTYDGIIRWLSSESFLGLKNGGMVLFGGFLIAGLLCSVFRYEYIQQKVVTLYFFIAFFVFLLYKPFVNDRTIERFTRGRYKSASELMQNINHFSYLYGLIIFSIEISVFVDIISILIQLFLFDKASTVNLIYLVIESMLVFTALYFLYHLYVSDADGRLEKMKLNIQLYSFVGITFIGLAASGERALLFATKAAERGAVRFPVPGKMLNFESPWDGMFIMDRLVKWNTIGGPIV